MNYLETNLLSGELATAAGSSAEGWGELAAFSLIVIFIALSLQFKLFEKGKGQGLNPDHNQIVNSPPTPKVIKSAQEPQITKASNQTLITETTDHETTTKPKAIDSSKQTELILSNETNNLQSISTLEKEVKIQKVPKQIYLREDQQNDWQSTKKPEVNKLESLKVKNSPSTLNKYQTKEGSVSIVKDSKGILKKLRSFLFS